MTSDKPENTKALDWTKETEASDELSAFTAKTANIETADHAAEAARLTQQDDFTPFLCSLADHCDRILSELGFPGAIEMVRHDGKGRWWRHPPNTPIVFVPGEKMLFARGYELAKAKGDLSESWYAGELGLKCRLALEHLAKGDAGKPFLNTMIYQIGALRTDWAWRRGQKAHVLRGRKTLKAAHEGADARRATCEPDTMKRLDAMRQSLLENPGKTVSWAAKALFKRGLGKSEKANRALWYRHNGK